MNSLEGERIFLRANLEGADDDIASIFQLWEELQLSAVEAALPELDVLSFASTAACFFPIYLKAPPPAPGPVIKDPQPRKSRKSRHKPLDLLALQPEQPTEKSTSQYSMPPVQRGSHTSDIWPEQTAEVVYPESTTTLQQTMLRFGLMEDELLRESTSTHQSFQVRDPYPLNIKKRSSNFIPNPFLKDVEDDVTEDDITSNTSQHSWENVERLWDDMDDQSVTVILLLGSR
ncbi:hypothetical protein DL96DRAFT_912723 [Flagelloscypha sp. PMI_526]|nr:hypothetical protein DL96DRAFT_912723 [Flagelloscypha sp. PMI_526]